MNITEKYYWITNHPAYVNLGEEAIIEVTPHMVCPETNRIEDLPLLNTKTQFWVELMIPYYDEQFKQHTHAHDWQMDCGGDTWELAIETLYNKVLDQYGSYTDNDIPKMTNEERESINMFLNNITISEHQDSNDDIIPLDEMEIESYNDDIIHCNKLLPVLRKKISEYSCYQPEYSDIQLNITCVEHDLLVATESLRLGYNVERYGYRDNI